jgi:hypothetical protein
LRVGVDDGRHGLVVGRPRLAEDVGGDDLALVLADVGQRPEAGDVADRPRALAGAQVGVDRGDRFTGAGTGAKARPMRVPPFTAVSALSVPASHAGGRWFNPGTAMLRLPFTTEI